MTRQSDEPSVEVGINVRDLDQSIRFYRDALGYELTGSLSLPKRRIVALRRGGSLIKLVQDVTPLEAANPRVSHNVRAYGFYALALNVEDAESVANHCTSLGYEVESTFSPFPAEVSALPGGGVALARDPDGNLIELVQGLIWDEPGDDEA